jgi:hypothetical protein
MRWIFRDRFSSLSAALVAMTGYVAWQLVMRALGANGATAWFIAAVLALGGIAWVAPHILRAWPLQVPIAAPMPTSPLRGEFSDIRRRLLLPTQQIGWRFDESPKVIVDPEVEHFASFVQPELERALLDILENPFGNPPAVMKGEVVRIERLHPSVADVPPLLLAYTTNRREHSIPTLALGPAAEVIPELAAGGDQKTLEALHRVVETVAERALGGSGQPRLAEHEA